jgi:ABC transporter substrate binding protein
VARGRFSSYQQLASIVGGWSIRLIALLDFEIYQLSGVLPTNLSHKGCVNKRGDAVGGRAKLSAFGAKRTWAAVWLRVPRSRLTPSRHGPHRTPAVHQSPAGGTRFRTFQICPKGPPACLWQAKCAADSNAKAVVRRWEKGRMFDLRRREFITLLGGAAAAWPFAARAQQGERMRRIGVLVGQGEDDLDMQSRLAGFREGLERLGWSEGRNLHTDYRFAAGHADRFQPLSKELIALQPDVILAQTPPVVAVMQRESRVIPIVFVDVSDPIGPGFVASLARPGGNLTGVMSFEAGITGKWLAMLKEIAPGVARACRTAAWSCRRTARHPASRPRHRARRAASSAGGVLVPVFCRCRRPHVLQHRLCRAVSARGVLCRPHPARRQSCRSSGAGADQV